MREATTGVLALLLLFGAGALADSPLESPLVLQIRSLSPRDRIQALVLLVESVATSNANAAQERRKLLATLLPQLPDDADAGQVVALRDTLVAALAADLEAAAAAPSWRARTRLARVLSLTNLVWFVACSLISAGVISLVGAYLAYVAAVFYLIPLLVWEAAGWGACLLLLRHATTVSPAAAPYVGLLGLLGLTACAGGSAALHLSQALKDSERLQAALLAAITAVWGTAAVRLQASLLGTCTVWWALTALGFSIAVFPFLTVIGFRGGLARPFGTAAALLLAFLPFKAAPEALPLPAALAPFETGVWVWCPLVANVANLILSHKHWTHGEHEASPLAAVWGAQGVPLRVRLRILVQLAAKCAASQLPNLAVVGGTVAVGILLDVEPCRAIGAVFLFLWLTSLLAQGDWRRVGFGWAALVFGGLLWAAAHAVHTWPAAFGLPPATGQATAAV